MAALLASTPATLVMQFNISNPLRGLEALGVPGAVCLELALLIATLEVKLREKHSEFFARRAPIPFAEVQTRATFVIDEAQGLCDRLLDACLDAALPPPHFDKCFDWVAAYIEENAYGWWNVLLRDLPVRDAQDDVLQVQDASKLFVSEAWHPAIALREYIGEKKSSACLRFAPLTR